MLATFVFWFSVGIVFYVYVGYPALLFFFTRLRPGLVSRAAGTWRPSVTVLISAYNEETSIEATLRNKLESDYPAEKLDIIVVSDASTDRTEHIVETLEPARIRLLKQERRGGKTAALNRAAVEATGDILVFSDANSMYDRDAIGKLVENFGDATVGYVTGKMIYTNPEETAVGEGCGTYMRYENQIRAMESRLGSIVGVDGGIDAIRRELYVTMKPDQLPDFILPLHVVEQGYRVVYDARAVLREPTLGTQKEEYAMRVRVSLRALWAIRDMRHLLSFRRSGLYAWQLWSHKLLRYLCFLALLGAYFSNLLLVGNGMLYKGFFLAQNLAYAGAILSPVLEGRGRSSGILYYLHYFALLNAACAHAFVKFLLGRKQATWTPRQG